MITNDVLLAEKERLLREIAKLKQKVDALSVLLDEVAVEEPQTYPKGVLNFLKDNEGKYYSYFEISNHLAMAKKVKPTRNFSIAINTTCVRLEAKGEISKIQQGEVTKFGFIVPKTGRLRGDD